MPKGGDRGGRRPRVWRNDSATTRHICVPPIIGEKVMQAALLIDQENPEILELLERLKG